VITRLLDFIAGREPVATATGIAAVVTAGLGLGAVFGLPVTAEQIAAIGALAAALAGWAARSAVTPVTSPGERKVARALKQPAAGDTVADDTRLPDDGGVPLALIILVVVGVLVVGGFFASCDALFDDQSEKEDLGMPALVLDHERYRCMDHDYCGGGSDGNTGYDGEGGRSGDMDQGGDNNCRNFCDNIIYIPSPGGGEERPR
jgi:hypothetical protein